MPKVSKADLAVAEFAKGLLAYVEDGNVVEVRECGFVDELRRAVRAGGLDLDDEDEDDPEDCLDELDEEAAEEAFEEEFNDEDDDG